ncbi:tyrosine-type recombinase/integrase [Vibrio diazotrophicus]|nr:tyrosine-type recombinase/integrase [Vibrio diazotrophicus]
MTVITARISEALIKEHASNPDVREINDPSLPVRFRYLTDRTKGSWFYCEGKIRYKKLGSWPLVKCALIRDMMPQIQINLASGLAAEKAVIGHFVTVSDLLDWHLDQTLNTKALSKLRKSGIKTAINCYLKPYIADLQLVDISRPVLLQAFFNKIQSDYSISTIYLAWGVLKTAFARARETDLLDINPISDMKACEFVKEKIKPKPSKLEARHLPAIAKQLNEAKHSNDIMLAMLLLLHGTRIGETRLARWEQFDLFDKTWTIPEEVTKGDSPELKVTLTDETIKWLKRHKQWQLKRGYDGVWLFRGSCRSALTPTQANNSIQRVSGRKWTAHDLRKAFRDVLTEVDTDTFVAERMLNHSLTSVQETYNKKEQIEKARSATERAHQWVQDRVGAQKSVMQLLDHD